MELKSVFNSEPKSIFDTLSESGICFYLPAYQRHYAWSKKNVERLFEDIIHGLENTVRNEDAITFIGTILTIHDTKYSTIKPFVRGQVPAKVMLIIDGQQRLTTMLLVMAALHESLRVNIKKLDKLLNAIKLENGSEENLVDIDSLVDRLNQEVANLRHFSTDTNSNKDKLFRWYPKIIRAYKDCWSKTEDNAEYVSPIAKFLHDYNSHVLACDEGGKVSIFKYEYDEKSRDLEGYSILARNYKLIRQKIKLISDSSSEESKIPSFLELAEGKFRDAFQFDFPVSLSDKDQRFNVFRESVNLLIFSKYLLNRVCLTYVTVADESYAFDMFEALNTTGEPLTSLETFKPKVIDFEGLESYEKSVSKTYFDTIDGFLDGIADPREKNNQTNRIMMLFGLVETGDKLTKHISDQRRYLIDKYRPLEGPGKRDFLKNLSQVVKYLYEEWEPLQPNTFSDMTDEKNQILMCHELLKEVNHEMASSVIQRYYSEYLGDVSRKSSLFKAIKACTAFFVLWRAAHLTTSGIDNEYRDLMKSGFASVGLKPLSRASGLLENVDNLKHALRVTLANKIAGGEVSNLRDSWVNSASKIPLYENTKALSKFLLLCAYDDTCSNTQSPGMLEKAAMGSSPMLSWHKWKLFSSDNLENKFTIEHVAPQTISSNWDESLNDKVLINTIGNLTILPANINSSVGNSSFVAKKAFFLSLCEDNARLRQESSGELPEKQQALLNGAHYLGFLQSITVVEKWNSSLIRKRSENILGHAWVVLYSWLE